MKQHWHYVLDNLIGYTTFQATVAKNMQFVSSDLIFNKKRKCSSWTLIILSTKIYVN